MILTRSMSKAGRLSTCSFGFFASLFPLDRYGALNGCWCLFRLSLYCNQRLSVPIAFEKRCIREFRTVSWSPSHPTSVPLPKTPYLDFSTLSLLQLQLFHLRRTQQDRCHYSITAEIPWRTRSRSHYVGTIRKRMVGKRLDGFKSCIEDMGGAGLPAELVNQILDDSGSLKGSFAACLHLHQAQ